MSTTDDDDILAAARAGFQSEAAELLVQFEQALLAIEQDPDDAEAMNCAFRAAHTMKGTAGLFGCDALVAFTHEVESLLDDVRSGQLRLSEAIVAVLLESRDQLERLLGELDAPVSSPDVARRSAELATTLSRLRVGAASTLATPVSVAQSALPAGMAQWRIQLQIGTDALRNGLDPLSFIRYLATLGRVVSMQTDTARVPDLLGLDTEACYLAFDIAFETERPRDDIVQAFDFLADDCQLQVDPIGSPAGGTSDERGAAEDDEALVATTATAVHLPEDERRGERDRRKSPRRADDTSFIRVRADKLDALIDMIGELVIASSGAQMVAQQEHSARFIEAATRIHDLVQGARDGALGLRMVPIGESFARFHRVVRDVCKSLGKDVALQITGGDTEMDKSMVETIGDPLMHLVRNSLDHGIETASERVAAGKPPVGQLALHAYHESGSILIEVSDDGRGLDRERILAKAVAQGLVPADVALDDDAVYQLIFKPGFSTAEAVTSLSGRGVGMDVVKSNVESLRGQIKIASQAGRGTTIQIRLPLTLAIIDGFLTSVAGVSYVVPLEIVAECIEMPAACAEAQDKPASCFDLRGEVVPCINLRRHFRLTGAAPARQSLIVVRTTAGRLGLLVDRLHGEYQTVIKPLSSILQSLQGIAGSTILGSGEVALILDVAALERQAIALQAVPVSHSSTSGLVA